VPDSQVSRDQLQEQYDLLSEEIQYLRQSQRTDDLSPRERFRLKKQIEEVEAEREQVEKQLESLDHQTLNSEGLYRTLWRLGYRRQVRLFRKLVETKSVGSFLIHGLPDFGQRWLLNRLVFQYVPYFTTGKVVTIDVSRKVRKRDVSTLWRELSGRVGLRETQPSHADIVEQIYQCWQTQNVLLVFHDVNCMPESGLEELIHQFWLPLADKAREAQESPFKLLMFLVDYQGCVEQWQVPWTEKLDITWQPPTPIRSPRITEFSDDDLIEWLEDEFDQLPRTLTSMIDKTVQEILTASDNGIPEFVLEAICDRCGLDWYEESEKWLKL